MHAKEETRVAGKGWVCMSNFMFVRALPTGGASHTGRA